MGVKTNGKASTEWKAIKVSGLIAIGYMVFMILAKNVFHWDIPEEANKLLTLILGGNVTYIGGRSFYKGMLAKNGK